MVHRSYNGIRLINNVKDTVNEAYLPLAIESVAILTDVFLQNPRRAIISVMSNFYRGID